MTGLPSSVRSVSTVGVVLLGDTEEWTWQPPYGRRKVRAVAMRIAAPEGRPVKAGSSLVPSH